MGLPCSSPQTRSAPGPGRRASPPAAPSVAHLVACFLTRWFSHLGFPKDTDAAGLGTTLEPRCPKLPFRSLLRGHSLQVFSCPSPYPCASSRCPLTPCSILPSTRCLSYSDCPPVLTGADTGHSLQASARRGAPGLLPPVMVPEPWLSHRRPRPPGSALPPLKLTGQPQPTTSLHSRYV